MAFSSANGIFLRQAVCASQARRCQQDVEIRQQRFQLALELLPSRTTLGELAVRHLLAFEQKIP
jgi:hypothetical protein